MQLSGLPARAHKLLKILGAQNLDTAKKEGVEKKRAGKSAIQMLLHSLICGWR